MRRFAAEHCAGIDLGPMHLLGTSGTVTTIAGIHLRLKRYDRRQVDGCWMIDEQVTAVLDELRAMSYDERVASPCIGAERADLVLAGCAILEAIRRVFPCTRLRVADRGLREGMLVEMMRADEVWARRSGRRDDDDARRAPLKVRRQVARSALSRRSAGSSASSTILTWRAPGAKACARAPPTS